MSDLIKISLTALSAVLVFVIGQILQRLFIEPIQEQRRLIGRVASALTAYENSWLFRSSYGSDPEATKRLDADSRTLHALAADLRASVMVLPFYDFCAFLKCVMDRKDVWECSNALLRWGAFNNKEDAAASRAMVKSIIEKTYGEWGLASAAA